ncbi:MAG: DNA-processing protein DprA [Lachnospiraceae bacterium]|nr:DNA-processing protein DprA [Lachnospiraceae bacterium]
MEKRLYHLYLAELACAMPQSVRNLLNEYGSAERIWTLTEAEIDRIFYLKETQKAEMKLAKTRGLPKRQLEEMEKKEIGAVCIEEEDYPERLRQLTDAPYMLFYKGRLPAEEIRMVAVIGARRCSDYGRRAADYFGRELAKAGVPVISGLAVGIDGLSQSACVEEGGVSYGVLGSGVDIVYPAGNRQLYQTIQGKGGVLSEYLPGTPAAAWHFPQRNRIISGLADLVLVVEAREKSGTLITVEYALQQGKEVFAVPGRVGDNLSLGCNRLIRDGAGIATCAEDLVFALQDLGNRAGGEEKRRRDAEKRIRQQHREKTAQPAPEGLIQAGEGWQGERRTTIRKRLLTSPASAEELYALAAAEGESVQELLTELLVMEIEGLIICKGGRYELK